MFTYNIPPSAEKFSEPDDRLQPFRWPGVPGPSTSSGVEVVGAWIAWAIGRIRKNPPLASIESLLSTELACIAWRFQTNARHCGGAGGAAGAAGAVVLVPARRGSGAAGSLGTALLSYRKASLVCFSSQVKLEYLPGPTLIASAGPPLRGLSA